MEASVLCDVSEQILFQYMGRMENLPDRQYPGAAGICLLVRRYMKLRYRNWSQKGSAETYLQDTEDSIYYQTWKAKEKQSEKKIPEYTGGRTVGSSGISFLYQLQQQMGMELCSRIYDGSNGVYRIYLLLGSDPEILEK